MTTCADAVTLYRNADWLEEIRLQTTDEEGYDLTGCELVATLAHALLPDVSLQASISGGTIDPVQLVGQEAIFTIRVQQEVFAAACPRGDYVLQLKLSLDGDDVILPLLSRQVRDGV